MTPKTPAISLIQKLLKIHRRFLELERLDAESYFNKKITPLEFFHMLTQNANFSWLRPFSAMIAAMDAFSEEVEMTPKNKLHMVTEIQKVLALPKIKSRYETHKTKDTEFLNLHEEFVKMLDLFERM